MGLIKATSAAEKNTTEKVGTALKGKVADKKDSTDASKKQTGKENVDSENKKTIPKTGKTVPKPSGTNLPTVGKKGKDEDLEDDPIAKSLEERKKAGSITEVVPEKKDGKKTRFKQLDLPPVSIPVLANMYNRHVQKPENTK